MKYLTHVVEDEHRYTIVDALHLLRKAGAHLTDDEFEQFDRYFDVCHKHCNAPSPIAKLLKITSILYADALPTLAPRASQLPLHQTMRKRESQLNALLQKYDPETLSRMLDKMQVHYRTTNGASAHMPAEASHMF